LQFLLFGCLPVFFGDGVVQKLVNCVDDMCAHKGEATKAPTIHNSYGQWRTIDFLFWQFNIEKLDQGGEVGVPFRIHDHRRLYYVPSAFNIHTRLVHGQPMDTFEVTQAPEKNLDAKKIKVKAWSLSGP
jgi:hypothetical protein